MGESYIGYRLNDQTTYCFVKCNMLYVLEHVYTYTNPHMHKATLWMQRKTQQFNPCSLKATHTKLRFPEDIM